MKSIRFKIPGNPIGKGRPRFTRMGHAYTPDTTAEYEKKVKSLIPKDVRLEGPVSIYIEASYPIPKGTSQKKLVRMLEGHEQPLKKPDLDNVIKIILDSIQGIGGVIEDDKQVMEIHAEKYYDEEPYVCVTVSEMRI